MNLLHPCLQFCSVGFLSRTNLKLSAGTTGLLLFQNKWNRPHYDFTDTYLHDTIIYTSVTKWFLDFWWRWINGLQVKISRVIAVLLIPQFTCPWKINRLVLGIMHNVLYVEYSITQISISYDLAENYWYLHSNSPKTNGVKFFKQSASRTLKDPSVFISCKLYLQRSNYPRSQPSRIIKQQMRQKREIFSKTSFPPTRTSPFGATVSHHHPDFIFLNSF